MSRIVLGGWVNGGFAKLDLPRLLESRMLLQASSGGGKSWALRRLLEVTSGQVQQIIIDPEGEFASLREKHDLIIAAAAGGDALAHPKTATLLATRLLETGVSAVLDIYDLKKRDREQFVQLFVDALVNAPKTLWHSVMVVIDEAHMFCDENEKSVSTSAVIDLATRGRKRGLCLVAATQRISDFNKSAAAQLKNKLIGNTGLDVDVKRAAFELGKQPKEAMEMLRGLNPGEFYAFGPALSAEIKILKIGDVETTHPKVGHRQMLTPPKPTEAIKAILPKLADLPKEAEEEARTVAALQRELAATKRDLVQAKRDQPAAKSVVDPTLARRHTAQLANLTAVLEELMKFIVTINAKDFMAKADERIDGEALQKAIGTAVASARQLIEQKMDARNRELQAVQREGGRLVARVQKLLESQDVKIRVDVKHNEPFTVAPVPPRPAPVRKTNGESDSSLGQAARKILTVLAQYPGEGCTAGKLALLTGYSYSGGFRNSLSELRTAGCIEGSNTGVMTITPDGEAQGPFDPLPAGDELLAYWLNHQSLGKAAREILRTLGDGVERTADELATATGYEYSGGFRNSLSELRTAGVITGKNTGTMRIARDIVP